MSMWGEFAHDQDSGITRDEPEPSFAYADCPDGSRELIVIVAEAE